MPFVPVHSNENHRSNCVHRNCFDVACKRPEGREKAYRQSEESGKREVPYAVCGHAPKRDRRYGRRPLLRMHPSRRNSPGTSQSPLLRSEARADAGCTVALANGTEITRFVQRDAYRRRLATNIVTSVNDTIVESLAYAYDALGRPVSRNDDTFAYNNRSEVVFSRRGAESAEDSYAYDEIGNLLSFAAPAVTNAYTANNLNQYAAISNLCGSAPLREFQYDPDGNMVSDGDFTYAYDAANRLVSVSSNGIAVATFAYDAQSRRVRKVTPAATHTYFYDGWNLVKETVQRSNGATVQRTYVWGKDLSGSLQGAGGVGGLLAVVIDGSTYFPFYDNNGSVTRYLDSSGATVAAYAYDAFGNIVSQSGPMADVFPHRFSTKYFDPETGLYYYGYRYYSPSLMRWLNRDPIEEEGGENLYAFCKNRTLDQCDNLGKDVYLYTGHTTGRILLDLFHQVVAADIWSQDCPQDGLEELVFLSDLPANSTYNGRRCLGWAMTA